MDSSSLIEKLVSFETVSRDSNLALIEFVENYLDDHGIASARVPSDDGRKSNLVASVGPEEAGGIVLSGHTDVVPVDGQDWHSDPFRVKTHDGRLYGRGTCDMKSFIAIALSLVGEMKDLKVPIHLALSYDEEVGCQGAPRMIDYIGRRLPPPKAVIVGEPTSMGAVTGHKGIVALRTTVTGYETHSSQTHRGVSAVMTAARLVNYLDGMARELADNTPADTGYDPHASTIHVGVIRGGTAINITARECVFEWDIRNIALDDPTSIIGQFETFCRDDVLPGMKARHENCAIHTDVLASAPALAARSDSPALALVQALTGHRETAQVAYAAEAGQYQDANLPAVLCGPGSIDQAHQPDEFITIEQVSKGERFLRRLIQDLSE